MTYLKNLTAVGAAVAFATIGSFAQAEDEVAVSSEELDSKAEVAPAAATESVVPSEDEELLGNVVTGELLRREAWEEQAKREMLGARQAMAAEDYEECIRRYDSAMKLLGDSAVDRKARKECEGGIAEAYYRAALQDWDGSRRNRAMENIDKAIEHRHPKAKKQKDVWQASAASELKSVDESEIVQVRNEDSYKAEREFFRRHLKRARQLLSLRKLDEALEQCETVLAKDPYNEEALRLRRSIIRKQQFIVGKEHDIAREGMIQEVEKKWRPVYAPNVRDLGEGSATTVRTPIGDDSERAREQDIIRRMKKIILPEVTFKPPATIIDVVESFRAWSKDFDDPKLSIEDRGFNFVLKTPEPLQTQAAQAADDSNEFGASSAGGDESQAGVPVIPMISCSNISLYEALKQVCDLVGYKFKVQGSIVMVMHKSITIEEMVIRSYPVKSEFFTKVSDVSAEMREMGSKNTRGGFGSSTRRDEAEEDDNIEQNCKRVFSELGVQWPEGSSIYYMKGTGKLRVKNTYDNLAELEKALIELNAEQKLIEIETRFVEVCQEDLNSLGFEWILNSDYTIGGGWLANKLGLGKAAFNETGNRTVSHTTVTTDGGVTTESATKTTITGSGETRWSQYDMFGNRTEKGIAGINAMGGEAEFGNTQRFISDKGNFISGQDKLSNDRFMKINAFLGTADLSMILHMLSQRSDTDLLSAPKVLTRPGEEAVIKVVTEYIYPTDYDVQLQSSGGSGGGYGGGGGSSMILAVVEPQSFTMREVGVILDVTPTLTDDGNLIDLKLNTQVVDEPTWKNYGMKIPFSGNSNQLSDFTGIGEIFTSLAGLIESLQTTLSSETKETIVEAATMSAMNAMNNLTSGSNNNITYYEAPMEQPFFHTRSIDTSVSVYPGATIAMGGLIREDRKAMDDKIPFLGDLPFVGRFFRSHSEWTNKKNLIIFVTTRLVDVRGREVSIGSGEIKDAEAVTAAPEIED